MKTIEVSGPYGELELTLAPGDTVTVRARGLFAIIDLKLRSWEPSDAEASLVIARSRQRRDKHPDAVILLGQLGKRPLFPLQLFYDDTLITFSTSRAQHPIALTVHHEAVAP